MRKLEIFAIASLLLVATAANAGWQEQASRFDAQRLARLDESRAKGLDEASRGAPAADLAVIHSLLDAEAVDASSSVLEAIGAAAPSSSAASRRMWCMAGSAAASR